MIRIQQLKIHYQHTEEALRKKVCHLLHIKEEELLSYHIVRQSLDARKKPELFYVYILDVEVKNEKKVIKNNHKADIFIPTQKFYTIPEVGNQALRHPPIVIGAGPCGLFAALLLAQKGFCPIVLERGKSVEARQKDVETFWKTGILNPKSNVQFGEGGAGTFSDGKLNTLVKDKTGRNTYVLETFVKYGAPEKILYEQKPHVGTDILIRILQNIRQEIISLGGEFRFEQQVSNFRIENGCLTALEINHRDWLETEVAILAIGHSARDTFETLLQQGISMEAKSFAVGFRVEHPQKMINLSQYGMEDPADLPASPYKLTARSKNERGVYSFCMCPGGFVVNASSEEQRLAVNGMSYSARDSKNANSAIIVSVDPVDFGGQGPLAGMYFQRKLEETAYLLGEGSIPQQLYGDFVKEIPSTTYGDFSSCVKGKTTFTDLTPLFSPSIKEAFLDGMEQFSHKIKDFSRYDAILSGVESRTSSPIRIHRDEAFESNIKGLIPAGEGAGYAGGITSAAMDGLKTAEHIIRTYHL